MKIAAAKEMRQEESLIAKIKRFKALAETMREFLNANPKAWGKLQSRFNAEIARIFQAVMEFEHDQLKKGDEKSVYKFKQIFVKRLREFFLHGDYTVRSFKKPFGYAGDFQIIDDIYRNHATTEGFERLFDNMFLMSPASLATRNRKDDFKRILCEFISERGGDLAIMDLASGPCRDIHEIFLESSDAKKKAHFYCYENDENAIRHAKGLLGDEGRVSFIKENVVRLALKKNIEEFVPTRFDLIFSTGLFDYLDERISLRLITNLKKLLKPDGTMIIANYLDKYCNPSLHFMEWVGDWNLVYRSEDEFRKIFIDAGFKPENIQFDYEAQGIMQYCFSKNHA